MKHAYLIIAHNEFVVLQTLVSLLDDPRNAIYIHFDKKLRKLPPIETQQASCYILENRVDVRWGHASQIESEYALFEAVFRSGETYSRYHLISGTHLPLKSQDELHHFFARYPDQEVLSYLPTNRYEINMKLGRYHFFVRNYKHGSRIDRAAAQLLWKIFLKVQYWLDIKKPEPCVTIKANNWVSLTPKALTYVLYRKHEVLNWFQRSFCGDEFFIPYLLENSIGKFRMKDCPHLLYNDFEGDTPRMLMEADFEFLRDSDYLFARKFSEQSPEIIIRIQEHLSTPLNMNT